MTLLTKEPIQNFIGNGITYPINLDKGKVVLESGFELIKSSIKIILAWSYPQRFFLAEFNSRLESLLEEPNDQILKSLLQTFIFDSINQWEKRVQLLEAEIHSSDTDKINVQITYKIINSEKQDTFIYPFYRKIIY